MRYSTDSLGNVVCVAVPLGGVAAISDRGATG